MGDITLKNRSLKETERIVQKCTARQCTSLYKDKIYVCSRAAMMEKLGLIPPMKDSVPVNLPKRDFEKKMRIFFKKKSFEACRYCNGTAGLREIEPGAQLPNDSK